MYERLEECPSCKHTLLTNHIICKDYSVSEESFALMKCEKCHLIFTNPRPDAQHIAKYYESKDYISHTNRITNPINLAYKLVRWYTLRQKVSLIQRYSKKKRILDYGCGSGIFIKHLLSRGYEAEGYEPISTAVAQSNTEAPIHSSFKNVKKQQKYDLITAWHVIEHAHDLRDTLKLLRKRLTDKGFIFVAVPNINAYDAQYYKEKWAAYDVPRHLYHFSQESFIYLSKKCKLEVKAVVPMKFDAYYVALLSETFTEKPSKIRAVKTALESNKRAKTTGEYSSLIYILTK